MTQDERDLLVTVAEGLMAGEFNINFDRIRALIRKIREHERLQQEQWTALARDLGRTMAVGLDENAMPKRE